MEITMAIEGVICSTGGKVMDVATDNKASGERIVQRVS